MDDNKMGFNQSVLLVCCSLGAVIIHVVSPIHRFCNYNFWRLYKNLLRIPEIAENVYEYCCKLTRSFIICKDLTQKEPIQLFCF